MKSIAVVGAGAVGSYYGCRLVEVGEDVRFLLRSDLDEVRGKGFTVRSVDGDFEVKRPRVAGSAEELGKVDLVVVAWKATANRYAAEVVGPLLHEETRILTLQNGLGNVEHLQGLFGRERVLGGLCFVCINRLAAGVIAHTGGGMVTIGEREETGILDEVVERFGKAFRVKKVEDLALAQWQKLVWNVPFNGLCVLEDVDTQEITEDAKKILDAVIPGYARELMKNDEVWREISDISIVGHASPRYNGQAVSPEEK
ncbi:MAG: 2-dehydropantoate 2-reductase, partial [Verrucomicrobiota bacterium]